MNILKKIMGNNQPEEKTQFEKDLEQLHQYDAFARIVNLIRMEREISITEMHEAETKDLQQISGKILEADKYLQMFEWDTLKEKHRDRL